ncbi:MAG: hypothetical protein EWV61_17540, partial [Microcystis aeruginosa Ma_AC_P_19900807_S300]
LVCAVSVSLYRFQLLLGVGTLIEFYFKLIICITIPEEPEWINLGNLPEDFRFFRTYTVENSSRSLSAQQGSKVDKYQYNKNSKP